MTEQFIGPNTPNQLEAAYWTMIGKGRMVPTWKGGNFQRSFDMLSNLPGVPEAIMESTGLAIKSVLVGLEKDMGENKRVLEVGAGGLPFWDAVPISWRPNYTAIDLGKEGVYVPDEVEYLVHDMTRIRQFNKHDVILSIGSLDILAPKQLEAFARGASSIVSEGGRIIYFQDILPGHGCNLKPARGLKEAMVNGLTDEGYVSTFENDRCNDVADKVLNQMLSCILRNGFKMLGEIGLPNIPVDFSEEFSAIYLPKLLYSNLGHSVKQRINSQRYKSTINIGPEEYLGLLAGLDSILASQSSHLIFRGPVELATADFLHKLDDVYIAHHLRRGGFELINRDIVAGQSIETPLIQENIINYIGTRLGLPLLETVPKATSFIKFLEFTKV